MRTFRFVASLALAVALLSGHALGDEKEKALYERYGHKGPWAEKVASALGSYSILVMSTTAPFMDAWAAGCRDPLVGAIVLRRLYILGEREVAQQVWDQLVKDDHTAYPGGMYRYGLCPYYITQVWLAKGEEKVFERLEELHKQATSSGSAQGSALVRHAQVWAKVIREPNEAATFWAEHAIELRLGDSAIAHETLYAVSRVLERTRGPQAVVDFLKAEPAGPARDKFLLSYEQQARIAAKPPEKDGAPQHEVLVDMYPDLRRLKSHIDGWVATGYPYYPSPFRVQCEVRLISWPAMEEEYRRHFRLAIFQGKDERNPVAVLDIRPNRMVRPDVPAVDVRDTETPTAYVDPNAWRIVSIERQRNLFRLAVDGAAHRVSYIDPRDAPAVFPMCFTQGCEAEIRNLKVYAFSSVPADNAQIEEHFGKFIASSLHARQAEANDSYGKLRLLWSKVPEARPFIERLDAQMDGLAKIMTSGGLSLCTRAMMDKTVATGCRWTLDGDSIHAARLPGSTGEIWRGDLRFPLMLPDMEMTGTIDAKISPGDEPALWISWNTGKNVGGGRDNKVRFAFSINEVEGQGSPYWKVAKVKLTGLAGPIPFLLRSRGDEAVLFVANSSRPALRFGTRGRGKGDLLLTVSSADDKTTFRFGGLTIRNLPQQARLDAPADNMPSVPGVTTSQPSPDHEEGRE